MDIKTDLFKISQFFIYLGYLKIIGIKIIVRRILFKLFEEVHEKI